MAKTLSYYYYVDMYKYLAMHMTDDDKLAQTMYGVMAIECCVGRFVSGWIFTKLGIRKTLILNLGLNVASELLYLFFGQFNLVMFFLTFMIIRTVSSINMYSNYTIPFSIYGTKKAIRVVCYFDSFYGLVIIIASVLNYFFDHAGKIQGVIVTFFVVESVALFYSVVYLKERKIK